MYLFHFSSRFAIQICLEPLAGGNIQLLGGPGARPQSIRHTGGGDLWMFGERGKAKNMIVMENGPFMDDFPTKTSIYRMGIFHGYVK